jgi:hypothetical protein
MFCTPLRFLMLSFLLVCDLILKTDVMYVPINNVTTTLLH